MTGYGNSNWNPNYQHDYQLRQAIRRDSNFAGLLAVTQTILLQFVFFALFLVLSAAGILNSSDGKYYGLGNTGFLLLYSIIYIIGVGFPGPVISVLSRRSISPFSSLEHSGDKEPGFLLVTLSIMAGLSICVIANFATSYIVLFFNEIGIRPPEMPAYLENNPVSLALNILIFALLPAILEEMLYRGYILRTLLPHGKLFAIIASSLLFALMHGNILQIPFAFIVGLACGYLAVKTGSVWVAVMLHFLNNFMSVLLQYVGIGLTDDQTQKVIAIVFSILGIIGLYALIGLFASGDPTIRDEKGETPVAGKAKALFSAPAIIANLAVSLILIVLTTRLGG